MKLFYNILISTLLLSVSASAKDLKSLFESEASIWKKSLDEFFSGYNFSKKGDEQIIFSDSWGAGHERKTMPLKDAWAITTGIAVISPR